MRLPAGTQSGSSTTHVETVYYLHAEVNVYYPAPGGGSYCNYAVCEHRHPDTREGVEQMEECAARLQRIIDSGRLPKWATLTHPVV